tara:strand:- start:131 stop:514 length:384 start_codon:yes stop_codon:yes gene_type:complete
MKILKEEIELHCSASELWAILSDVARCDWVPSIEDITLSDGCRYFEMKGMGEITEKILKCDEQEMILQYSAIETPVPIEHHLATMQIFPISEKQCSLTWITEISPDIFSNGIHQGMFASIEGIKKVI